MKKIGEKNNLSVAQVGTVWAINKGTLPIVGVTKLHHVTDLEKILDVKLSDDEIKILENFADKANVSTIREWEKKMD